MHLDEEQLQRLLHGELAPRLTISVREHVAGCTDCWERLARAERDENEVTALLRRVDHPAPTIGPDAIATRARGVRAGWRRWAAGTILALGLAGVAYAAPGLPVRSWVRTVSEWLGGRPKTAPALTAPVPPAPAPELGAGIAVAPGPELVIRFTSSRTAGGQANVSLTDGSEVVVRAPVHAATFTSRADRLDVVNLGSATIFEVQIPRAARRVEIRVGGNRVFLKEGPRVITPESTTTDDHYVLPLTPEGS